MERKNNDAMLRRFLFLFIALPLLSRAAPTTIEFPVFVGGFGIEYFEDTARQYEARNPGVRINLYGDPRIRNRLRVRIIGEDYPDATDARLPWMDLIRAGKVADLTPFLDAPGLEGKATWRDHFLPGSLDRWTLEGKTYGIPFAHAVIPVFYNKTLFREHGWAIPDTWEEFFQLCEVIQAEGIAPVALPGIYHRYIDNFFRAAHYGLLGPEEYTNYLNLEPGTRDHPAFIRAAEVIQRIALHHLQPGWEGMSHTAAQLEFLRGKAAMVSTGSWLVSEMEGKFPEDFELGAFNFPRFEDSVVPPTHIQTGSGYYFIFSNSEHLEASADFLRFLTSPQRARAFAAERDSASAIAGVPASAYSPLMQDVAALLESSTGSYGQPPGSAGLFPRLNQVRTNLRMELLQGSLSPEAFAASLESAALALRNQQEHPGRITVRHPVKGGLLLLFLVTMTGLSLAAFWRANRNREAGRQFENTFGDLSPRMGVGFILPAFFFYTLFILVPAVKSFLWSFQTWNGLDEPSFSGLYHFLWLFLESDTFWEALGNNLFLMFVPGMVILPMATLFAYWIHRGVLGGPLFRVCFLFPNIMGGVAATILWLSAYEPASGLVNAAFVALGNGLQDLGLTSLGGLFRQFDRFAWLAPERLYGAIIPILVWQGCGFNLILLLAAMDGIDPALYESAEIEGASPARQFFQITLPLIWDAILIVLVFWIIAGLNAFELVWLLTGQEPASSSHVLSTWMVGTLFNEFQVGRATAIAASLFLLVLAGSALTWKTLRKEAVHG